jgi:hypothetical protein
MSWLGPAELSVPGMGNVGGISQSLFHLKMNHGRARFIDEH